MTLNKNMMNLIVAAFVATIFLNLVSTGHTAEPRRVVVEIRGFKFVPQRPALAPGDIVVWINKDIVPHTVTAKDGSWDSDLIEVGKQWTTKITRGMATDYFCAYHPMMKAGFSVSPTPAASIQTPPNRSGIASTQVPANTEPTR